jgi:hypothetical protein
MKKLKAAFAFSMLALFVFTIAWQAAADETDTPTPTLTPTPPPAPVADFSSNITAGTAPLAVQFTDESSGSPDGWQWSWGDQTINDTTRNPIHVFNDSGLYTITLTVVNPGGNSTTRKINYINATAVPAPTPTPSPTPTPTPKPTVTKKPSATPRVTATPKPSITPTPIVMPTIPPELLPIINESFATATPTPVQDPTPVPTLVPLPPQEPSPTPQPGHDYVPGIAAFAGFNVIAVALYAAVSYLFFRR